MHESDAHPTRIHEGFKIRPGLIVPYGATVVPGGVNFSVASNDAPGASSCSFAAGSPSRS